MVEYSVTTPWPDLSYEVAERIVGLVNEFNLETRQSRGAEERRFVEERLQQVRSELRDAENQLQGFLQSNRAFQNSPELLFEHDRLQRQVGMRQQVFTSLMQAYEQARIAEVRNTPVITVIVAPSEPVRPERRNLILGAFMGLLIGASVGVSLALGRDFVHRQQVGSASQYEDFRSAWRQGYGRG